MAQEGMDLSFYYLSRPSIQISASGGSLSTRKTAMRDLAPPRDLERVGAMWYGTGGGAMLARVYVTLKPGVLDPAGKAVERGLHSMGYSSVGSVRLGKYIELRVEEDDRTRAKTRVEEMCQKLLANTVVENYRVEVE